MFWLIQVITGGSSLGSSSSLREIFSGVPQGGKWSSFLWDFDINEMCETLNNTVLPFGYACYEIIIWWLQRCAEQVLTSLPQLYEPSAEHTRTSRHTLSGIHIRPTTKTESLNVYKRGFFGSLPHIWSKIPNHIINKGAKSGWCKIIRTCVNIIIDKRKHKQ